MGSPSTSSVCFYLRRRGAGEMCALLFILLSLASLASALLPLVAVVRKAAGFYMMNAEARVCADWAQAIRE